MLRPLGCVLRRRVCVKTLRVCVRTELKRPCAFVHVGGFGQALWTLFGFPNGPKHVHPGVRRVTCGQTHFWPFFDPLSIPKWGISRGLGANWSLRMATNSLKAGTECVSEHPSGPGASLENTFLAFFDLFGPFEEGLLGPNGASKRSKTGSKRPENVSLSTSNGPGSFLGGNQCRPFPDHFPRVLGPFWGQITPDTVDGLKTGKARVKGTPHVTRVDSVPRPGYQTPPAPGALGPVRGGFGAVWPTVAPHGQKMRTRGRNRTPRMVAWGPWTHPLQCLAPFWG